MELFGHRGAAVCHNFQLSSLDIPENFVAVSDIEHSFRITLGFQHYYHGRRLKVRLGGRSPPHLRWGNSPCIHSPNILRSSVIGCV